MTSQPFCPQSNRKQHRDQIQVSHGLKVEALQSLDILPHEAEVVLPSMRPPSELSKKDDLHVRGEAC
jgi:hypothetical protein